MREARSPLKVSSLSLPRGGHNAQTFDAELPTCLGWLSRYVSAPLAPIPTADGLVPVPNPYLAVGSGQHRLPWRQPTGRSVVTAAHGSTTRSGTANGSTSHGSTATGSTVNGGTANGGTANGSTTRPAS
jgi:hypothetical protein